MSVTLESGAPRSTTPGERELLLLETLTSLLQSATHSLGEGEAAMLLEVSHRISRTAQELNASFLLPGNAAATAEADRKRRRLLSQTSQQGAFCRAMLRRWRRSLALRRQLLGMRMEPTTYQRSFDDGMELR